MAEWIEGLEAGFWSVDKPWLYEVAEDLTGQKVGRKWYDGFVKRHPKVKQKTPELTTSSRQLAKTEGAFRQHFGVIEEVHLFVAKKTNPTRIQPLRACQVCFLFPGESSEITLQPFSIAFRKTEANTF